jgi:hypothetical protein
MTVTEAISIAKHSLSELFPGSDYRLEEVEFQDQGDVCVTISYRSQDPPRPGVDWQGRRAAIGIDTSRTYKTVHISNDGVVKSVRMRPIVVG